MRCSASGQHGGNPACAQLLPTGLRIIAAVPLGPARPMSGVPTWPPHRRDGLQQGPVEHGAKLLPDSSVGPVAYVTPAEHPDAAAHPQREQRSENVGLQREENPR